MDDLPTRLARGDVVLADGAMGTMLMERGLAPGSCPERFGLDRPEVLEEIGRSYLEAGAEILQTNTFGASPAKLAAYGLADRAPEINAAGVAAARCAARGAALVSGSCGPSGRLLAPYGDADPAAIRAGFEVQVRALVDAGADLVWVETMTDLAEATLAVVAAKAVAPGTPVVATLTFDRTPRGFFTVMGVDVERACRGLEAAGADVVGSNCGTGIEAMVEVAREFRRHTRLPLAFRPNAGLPRLVGGKVAYSESPAEHASRVGALVEAGAAIVGGCCGTTPEHTRALRAAIRG